jgi:hypothetical protein
MIYYFDNWKTLAPKDVLKYRSQFNILVKDKRSFFELAFVLYTTNDVAIADTIGVKMKDFAVELLNRKIT